MEYENFWIKDKVTTLKFSDKDWEKLRHSIDPVILKEYEEIEKRWRSGHKGIYVFIAYMRERVEQCWRVLKQTGSIYLHCDWHTGHYLKVMMDEVFGYNNFRNEIIWRSTNSTKSKTRFGTIHQTIFFYVKSDDAKFYPQKMPYTKEYIKTHFTSTEGQEILRTHDLTGAGITDGDSEKLWKGYNPRDIGRHWATPSYLVKKYKELTDNDLMQYPILTRLDKLDDIGLIHWTRNKTPIYKSYLSDASGVTYQDIWASTRDYWVYIWQR